VTTYLDAERWRMQARRMTHIHGVAYKQDVGGSNPSAPTNPPLTWAIAWHWTTVNSRTTHFDHYSAAGIFSQGRTRRVSASAVAVRTHLKIALLEAAGQGQLDQDPDQVMALLGPAIDAVEAEVSDLQSQVDAGQQTLDEERSERAAERRALDRLRVRAERDAVAAINAVQPDVLTRPWGCYVYFLRDHSDRIMYIGMSTNLMLRLGVHLTTPGRRGLIASISVIECRDEATMRRMEGVAIREHQPPWNVLGIVA
jgi:hypothetical protein